MNCPTCKDPMRELLTSAYCANGCEARVIDPIEEDPTTPHRVLRRTACACGSSDIGPFDLDDGRKMRHCWTCGAVFE